jgi:hypothetical protein
MSDTADYQRDSDANRAYAAWATKPTAMPRFILRHASGTMIRFQSGGLGTMALFLCALSISGLAVIALLAAQ